MALAAGSNPGSMTPVAAVAGIDELNGAGRCGEADQGQLE